MGSRIKIAGYGGEVGREGHCCAWPWAAEQDSKGEEKVLEIRGMARIAGDK